MRRSTVLSAVVAAAVAAAAPALAQVPLPPDAELFLRRRTLAGAPGAERPAIAADRVPADALFAISRGAGGEQIVGAFLRVRPGTEAALIALGVEIGARAPGWLSARVPVSRLADVAATPGVTAVELARRARLHNDSAMRDIGVLDLRQRTSGDHFRGSTGRGAIVGIVDTGIDLLHPDFIEDDLGRSRIVYLWDQTGSGRAPGRVGSSTFSYGDECTRAEIDAEGCDARDGGGHGTHVAGTAAGDGSGARRGPSTFAYAGVAPGAELIIVKTDLSFSGIVDGVDYVFRRAAELGRPAVVNLSIGSDFGPHDGNEAPSLMIDALTGPGRIVVAAAGNDGTNHADLIEPVENPNPAIHADVVTPVGDSSVVAFTLQPYIPFGGGGNDLILIQAFFDPTDNFALTVVRPNGSRVELIPAARTAVDTSVGGGVLGYIGSIPGDSILAGLELGSLAPTSPSNTASLYIGEWIVGGRAPAPGEWRLIFRRTAGTGSGVVDVYLPIDFTRGGATFTIGATNRRMIGPPGDARTVITVGAYSTRRSWDAVDSRRYRPVDLVTTGALLQFSSPGPTRDGRQKPDISAPGRVISALSRDAGFPRELIDPDSSHALLEGTSMSTPLVTGAVALLLAERPTLTPAQALAALASSARQDEFTAVSQATGDAPGGSNNSWGAGKLNVPGALAAITELAGRAIAAANRADSGGSTSRAGTVIELQSLRVAATDPESLSVTRLAAQVTGRDAGFRLGVVVDADRNGIVGGGEPVVATSASSVLAGEGIVEIAITPGALVVPRGGTVDLLVVGVLSGATPNQTSFTASVDNDRSMTVGLTSGQMMSFGGGREAGSTVTTTLLQSGERYNLSQNPVRVTPLIINLGETATAIEVYDFRARLVWKTALAAEARSVRWDLATEGGGQLANGAYILLIRFPSGAVRRQLFVVR
jgi:subtilisin family serine protease